MSRGRRSCLEVLWSPISNHQLDLPRLQSEILYRMASLPHNAEKEKCRRQDDPCRKQLGENHHGAMLGLRRWGKVLGCEAAGGNGALKFHNHNTLRKPPVSCQSLPTQTRTSEPSEWLGRYEMATHGGSKRLQPLWNHMLTVITTGSNLRREHEVTFTSA